MNTYKVQSLVIILIVFSIQLGCKSSQPNENIPSCINSKIETIKMEPVGNPPAEIWKWETDGKTYYYFNSPCCDQFNYLYNDKCEMVCAPDGGFTGKGDQKCPDFGDNVQKTLVWKDQRKG